jgi:hypothetical protein
VTFDLLILLIPVWLREVDLQLSEEPVHEKTFSMIQFFSDLLTKASFPALAQPPLALSEEPMVTKIRTGLGLDWTGTGLGLGDWTWTGVGLRLDWTCGLDLDWAWTGTGLGLLDWDWTGGIIMWFDGHGAARLKL